MNARRKGTRNENRCARPLEPGVDPLGTRTLMDDSNPHGRRQCTARAKQTGERCRKAPVTGRTVCRSHGGATPVGAALPQYKGAGRSKYLPVAMAARYRAAQADSELLALRKDLALLEVRLATLLERLPETGQATSDAATWAEIRELLQERLRIVEAEHKRLVDAQQMVPVEQALVFVQELAAIIRRHVSEKAVLTAITAEFARLVTIDGPKA